MTVRQLFLKSNIKKLVEDYAYEVVYQTQQFQDGVWDELCSEGATYVHQIITAKWSAPNRVLSVLYSPYANILSWRIDIPEEALQDTGYLADCETLFPELYLEILGYGKPNGGVIQHEIQYPALIVLLSLWDSKRTHTD